MAYRNIFVANTATLSAKNEQLIVDNGERFSFPIEDIRCVLVDDNRTLISASVISKFADAGVTLIVCNSQHIPTAALNPINCYSRQLRQLNLQLNQSLPSKKRMWQTIVSVKIANQARCLELMQRESSEKLYYYAKNVMSGDPKNVEGTAAAAYFKMLFGNSFRRDDETPLNSALNYGYAIIRAIISRTICLYGFEPCLGIHHCSEMNNFNLADDIIEPFRPFVDLVVAKTLFSRNAFDTPDKAELLRSVNAAIQIDGKNFCVSYAIEKVVQSYAECLKNNKNELLLPNLIDLEYNEYE